MKKKSMNTLANLAPRRRDRGIKKEKMTEVKESVTPSLPANTYEPGPFESGAALTGNQDQNVDRLASELLESTIFSHPNGLRSHPSVLLCASEPMAFPSHSSGQKAKMDTSSHNLTISSPSGGNTTRSQSYAQASEMNQIPPAIPRKSSRRRRGKRTKNTDNELHLAKRSFPQSKTTLLDAGNRHGFVLSGSTTAPLGVMPKQAVGSMSDTNPDAVNPNLVNDKLAAMLAATEVLKPRGSQEITPTISIPSRNRRKKVMSKVRQALDIFQSKPKTPESSIRGKISAPIALATCDMPNPAVYYHLEEVEDASPASSAHPRANEDDDMFGNRKMKKSQTIIGGCIVRKPVPNDGSVGSSDDPFSEAYEIIRTPTPFEHRLKISIDSTDDIPPVPVLNPFAAEKDFDADLEGILSEKPLCASTPRTRTVHNAASPESPSKRYAKGDKRHLGALEETEGNTVACGPVPRKLKLAGGMRLFRDQADLSMKKHPSPSKDELNDLETRFRAYAIEQIKKAPLEEREALEIKFAGLIGPNALTPRDKNAPMKSHATKDIMYEASSVVEHKHTRESSIFSSKKSRIPRPVEPITRVPFAPRFAPQRQPTNFDAMELDELQ
ncbi:hypothetical protein CGRA01v4_11913 [Colletotrichum graminicola]|uniref:Uncharacterized protein n=1 Tax=Colletotrichum graminicola (strain M1.001 / M2 / FGSC 10212) TaxID=645133 RepID=E3QBE3_COLGM|nr:uncharacterized protein GLRG_03426 [Colletotrichum graminicola M1.001]EFQ28282.1 hypothetical protein GLRG_03426 [Colletotrichum graminicola M1.001]WDK20626.1 hypothetical protein CGRA01v4_11913 [Colletotrichum graminicola]